MKLNKIAVSCALALATLSSQAYALTAFDAPDADLDVFLSGASAPQAILGGIANQLFDAAQGIFVFYDNGGTATNFADDGKNYRTYFGVVKAGPGVDATLVGKKVRLQHRAKGGSVFGVEPLVGAQQGIASMNVSSTSCVANTVNPTVYGYACSAQGEDTSGSKVAPNRVPDFGVSDVEPRMFKAPYNTEPGHAQVDVSGLTSFGTNAVLFGVPVTTPVPSTTYISKAALAGMLNGDVQDWHQVDPAIVAGTNVVVCRRVQGSGTQATYNSLFSHFPCEYNSAAGTGSVRPSTAGDSASVALGTATGTGTVADPFIISPMDGYTVVESDSSGKVRDCLKAAKNGSGPTGSNGPITFQAGDGSYYRIDFGTGNYSAVGTLSLDSAGQENGWSFRSLDGVASTKANLIDVKYDTVSEQSMQVRADLYPATRTMRKFIDLFIKKAGDPAILAGISNVAVRDSVAALPINGNTPATSTNVMKGTRYGNSCSPIRKLY